MQLLAEVCLIGFLICILVWGIWRVRKGAEVTAQYLPMLPPANQLSFVLASPAARTFPSFDRKSAAEERFSFKLEAKQAGFSGTSLNWTPAVAAAGLDGAIGGWSVLESFRHIDPSVLKAIEASTSDHLHSLDSVHSYLEQHFFDAPAQTAEGWIERLSGYVMEQKVASSLEAAGHHVEFASTANQPLWDLIVDGHPVQVKEGLAGAKAYVLEHHGIPVYTGEDVASALKDPMVHGVESLSSDTVHELTRHSVQGVSDGFAPAFHFPIVTALFSGYREVSLLLKEHTTINQALVNVGLDVAGVGAGFMAGAKAGALIGAIGTPIGAAIGAFIGAIGGAIGGKLLATNIRHLPFETARDGYKNAVRDANVKQQLAISRSKKAVNALQSRLQARWKEQRSEVIQNLHARITEEHDFCRHSLDFFCTNFSQHLLMLLRQIREERVAALSVMQLPNVWRFVLKPTEEDQFRAAVKVWFRRAEGVVRGELAQLEVIRKGDHSGLNARVDRFLAAHVFHLDSTDTELNALVRKFDAASARCNDASLVARDELSCVRAQLIAVSVEEIVTIQQTLAEAIREIGSALKGGRDKLIAEARAVGVHLALD